MLRVALATVLIACLPACQQEPVTVGVSVIDLAIHPDLYVGKRVTLDGYLVDVGDGWLRVYLSSEQADHLVNRLSVMARVAPTSNDTGGCDGQYATLTGDFVFLNGYMIDSVETILCDAVLISADEK
jgi:hypothetical protein